MQGDKSIRIHRPHVAGPKPTLPDRLGGGLRVLPISAHYDAARHQNFANFPKGQRCARRISDTHQNRALCHAHRPQARLPIVMAPVTYKLAAQRRDAHGTLPLAIDLHKFIAQDFDRLHNIGHIHRTAGVGDGLDPLA